MCIRDSFTTGLLHFPPFRMPPVPSKQTSKGCLLYTSPSPRDDYWSRMPSSAWNYVCAYTHKCLSPVFQCYNDNIWLVTQSCLKKKMSRKKAFLNPIHTTLLPCSSHQNSCFGFCSFTTGLLQFPPFRMPPVPSKQTSKGSEQCSPHHLASY